MAATQNGLALPAEVTLQASEAEVKFTPRELRMIREFYGRSFTQIVSDDDTDDKFSVFAWLKLRRAGYDVTPEDIDDTVIAPTGDVEPPDPTFGANSTTSLDSASSGE